jgi:hypothetical protein
MVSHFWIVLAQYFFEVSDIRNSIIELVYPFKTVCRTKEEHTEKTKAFCETVNAPSNPKGKAYLS